MASIMDRVRRFQKDERSDRAKEMDGRRQARVTYDNPTEKQAKAWMRDPSRSDILGVDTPVGTKPKPAPKRKSQTKAKSTSRPRTKAPAKAKPTSKAPSKPKTEPSAPKKRTTTAPSKAKGSPKPMGKAKGTSDKPKSSKGKGTSKVKTVPKDVPEPTDDVFDFDEHIEEYEAWRASGYDMDPARSGPEVPMHDDADDVIDYSEEMDAYYAAMDAEDVPAPPEPVSTYEPDDFEDIDRRKGRLPWKKKRERRTPVGEYSESYYRKLLGKGDDPAAYSAMAYAMSGEGEPIEGALEYLIDAGYEDEAENSRWKWDSRETNSAFLRKKAQEIREQEMYYASLSGNEKGKGQYVRKPNPNGTVTIPKRVLNAPARVICGGQVYDYGTRLEAINEFREAVAECDGAERERYMRILDGLLYSDFNRVSDGVPVNMGGRKG